jgi:hypothetical protein
MFVPVQLLGIALSRGLATTMTLNRVSRGCRESIKVGRPASDLIFVPYYVVVLELRFKWYTLYNIFHFYVNKCHTKLFFISDRSQGM